MFEYVCSVEIIRKIKRRTGHVGSSDSPWLVGEELNITTSIRTIHKQYYVSKFTGLVRVVDEGRWEFQIKFLGVPDMFENRVYMLNKIEIE
jgi:hypothetical protein